MLFTMIVIAASFCIERRCHERLYTVLQDLLIIHSTLCSNVVHDHALYDYIHSGVALMRD